MTPWTVLGTAVIPGDGGELTLRQRGADFSISVKGPQGELMNSRVHSSEEALAELGCAHIRDREQARVLVGGLGMGFTLAAALGATMTTSGVVVAELIPEVVEWNKGALGECAGRPLDDPRVLVHVGDVAELFKVRKPQYDAVLLDVDNGPEGFTQGDNNSLYSIPGLQAIAQTLRPGGVLAVWSGWHDPQFTQQLKQARYKVETKTVRAHKGKGSRHTIYLARKR